MTTQMSDECRPEMLPSGEVIRVRGARPFSEAERKSLGELVEAARRRMPPPNPGALELHERIVAALAGLEISRRIELAPMIGVKYSVLGRIPQGRMPDADDLAKIETWLAEHGV